MRVWPIIGMAAAAIAAPVAASPSTPASEYKVKLVPEAPDLKTRLMLFAEGPAASTGMYGEGTGAFELRAAVPESGAATFRQVPVRFRVNGRSFAGLATVTFNNGAFEGLVAETLNGDGTAIDAALKVEGGEYAFGEGSTAVTGRISAAPSVFESVPEPATWAMMVVGFGLAGLAIRRQVARMVEPV